MRKRAWEPPAFIAREELVKISEEVLGLPDIAIYDREDIFRIKALGFDWDIACQVIEPDDAGKVPVGPDGKKAGMILLHGGAGDHRQKIPLARFISAKYGYKVVCPTYPGRYNFASPKRDWPDDTVHSDGTVRTPVWEIGRPITPDQYEVLYDRSDPEGRRRNGTRVFAVAREGTEFYDRMAGWPVAMEEGLRVACRRHLRMGEWTIYAHGHSTGGPFIHMLLQRVENIAGLIGLESSPFGYIYGQFHTPWTYPFNYLNIRTWRDRAGYTGPELGKDGIWEKGLVWVMEDVLEDWDKSKRFANFKAEHPVHLGCLSILASAARVSARRLGMTAGETEDLVKRYQGYTRELSGPWTKPVPPLLYGIAQRSRDHTPDKYAGILWPALAAMDRPPKARLVQYDAGVHGYEKAEEGLPRGLAPAMIKTWNEAIMNGYYR